MKRTIHIAKRLVGQPRMSPQAFPFCAPAAPLSKARDTWTDLPNFATCRKCKTAFDEFRAKQVAA